MTYRSLKTFIKNNRQENNEKIFDLIPKGIKSKIIFVTGEGAPNTACYLSSIMSACEIPHLHYINSPNRCISKRFLINNIPIAVDMLCENAQKILESAQKIISNDDLLFLLSISFSDDKYAIIEISEEYYDHLKNYFSPFALILAINDDLKTENIINSAPKDVKEIISLSENDDFDYISTKFNHNGTRITLASPNKIIVSNSNVLGTSFYHYNYLYRTSAINLNNIPLAHLAIEAAGVLLSAPRPYIYKGLENVTLPDDLILYSLSPAILLYEGGEKDFRLHHKLKFNVLSEGDEFEAPTENTLFFGSKEYVNEIKEKLKKR